MSTAEGVSPFSFNVLDMSAREYVLLRSAEAHETTEVGLPREGRGESDRVDIVREVLRRNPFGDVDQSYF